MDIITIPPIHNGHFKENEIYVGDQRNNLPRSKWYMPEIRSLSLYRDVVSNSNFDEMKDDTILMCLCNFWKKCHGHVLLYLAMKKNNHIVNLVIIDAFSPLSHTYKFPFTYEQKEYVSLAEAYYSKRKENKQMRVNQTLTLLYTMLTLKYEQCKEFRELLVQHENDLIVQNAAHAFWGKGDGEDVKSWSGQNIGGWLIMHIFKKHCKSQHRRKLIYVCEGEVNTNLLKGLQLVNKSIGSACHC